MLIVSVNIQLHIDTYNEHVFRLKAQAKRPENLDDFVSYDDHRIKWSSRLKDCLRQELTTSFEARKIRESMYRPFTRQFLYFDSILTHRRGVFPAIFPTPESEQENRIITVCGYGRKEFSVLMCQNIPDLNFYADPQQSFPFYTYEEDGSHRRENITDHALDRFRSHFKNPRISKWDIFYYVYGILHSPEYRKRYALNLKRELPRIPFARDFRVFAKAGKKLASLHLEYEKAAEFPLQHIEDDKAKIHFRVEKMRFSKDRSTLIYNEFLSLAGFPEKCFEYRLGNRSAVDWIVDQYRVKKDPRSGIENAPNRPDDEKYILQLIGKVVTVSVETMKIVKSLPEIAG